MRLRIGVVTVLLGAAGCGWAAKVSKSSTRAAASPVLTRPTEAQQAAEVFQTNRIYTIHIQLTPERWEMMQPVKASRLAMLMGVPQHPVPELAAAEDDTSDRKKTGIEGRRQPPSPFGFEFAYVRATVEIDGEALRNVGVRFKGNYSYQHYAAALKRPMKLDFNRFVPGQKFHGLESVNLHNNTSDATQLREALSYAVFRDAGVPAPRTAFAMVFLTVSGRYNHEFVGLYNLVEEEDKHYLRDRFGTSKGLLLKPEQTRNLPYLGDDWDEYRRFRAKTDAGTDVEKRFIDFTKLVHHADDETFYGRIGAFIDIDEFARFLAVNTLLINMDSFLGSTHNVYMYVHPEDGRVYFMPWDLHLSFASGGPARNDAEYAALSLEHPYMSSNRLIERLMMLEDFRQAYFGHLREFSTGIFSPAAMNKRLGEMQVAVDRANKLFWELGGDGNPTTRPSLDARGKSDLSVFVKDRVDSVLRQLAGTSDGYIPGERPFRAAPPPAVRPRPGAVGAGARAGRGPGGRTPEAPSSTPAPNGPEAALRGSIPIVSAAIFRNIITDRPALGISRDEAAAAVKLFFMAVEPPGAHGLNLEELARGFEKMERLLEPSPVPLPPDGKAPGSEDPHRVSMLWAKAVLTFADADKDGRLTREEMLSAAERLFRIANLNGDAMLNQRELVSAMESVASPKGR